MHDLLTRYVYAEYIEAPNWGITLRKGQHEGLISLTTFDRIQERLKGNAKAPARKDINADFPLRGFVLCNDCGKPLTACWSKGKMGVKYPIVCARQRAARATGSRSSVSNSKVNSRAYLSVWNPLTACSSSRA